MALTSLTKPYSVRPSALVMTLPRSDSPTLAANSAGSSAGASVVAGAVVAGAATAAGWVATAAAASSSSPRPQAARATSDRLASATGNSLDFMGFTTPGV